MPTPSAALMTDVMVDLETTGKRPGCGLLSIGAVFFDPIAGKLGNEFYTVVNRQSCIEKGLHEDPSTLEWWEKQSPAAKRVLDLASMPLVGKSVKLKIDPPNVTLHHALNDFMIFSSGRGKRGLKVWGCGADFDNVILLEAMRVSNIEPHWEFWNNRCYRTMRYMAPAIKIVREGTYHNALSDAKNQANHLNQIFKHLALNKKAKP